MQLQDFYPIIVTEHLTALPLRDEPFGQRRFGLFDPAGVWVDVLEQIDPSPG